MEHFSEEVKQKTNPPHIRLNISSQGDIDFDAQGVDEWQLIDAIAQARKASSEARRSHQQLQQLQASNLFWLHLMGGLFATILIFSTAFTIARVVSGQFNSQSGVSTYVK